VSFERPILSYNLATAPCTAEASVNPRLRRWLQPRLQRWQRTLEDVSTIRAGDPLAAHFAAFGDGSVIQAPIQSILNPGSVSIGSGVVIRSNVIFEALAPPGTVILRIGDRWQLDHAHRSAKHNGLELA